MPEQDFEAAFAQLAYAELEQRAPGLMPYLIGFQLLKKNDDDSHAVGVFGFRVGNQWYYATPFWLNGKIKGFDLLYIVSQDLFVPLQEAWVNYVTNRKPYVMGEVEPKNLQQLGVSTPDFYPFRRSPLSKQSSDENVFDLENAQVVINLMHKTPTHPKYDGLLKRCSLTEVMKRSPELAASLLATMQKSAKFAEAVYQLYEPKDIAQSAEVARRTALFTKRAAEGSTDITDSISSGSTGEKVTVLYGTGNMGPDEMQSLSTDQRKALMRGDAVVEDNRKPDEKSDVYASPQYEQIFQNPTLSGRWNVLLRNGEYTKALVCTDPITPGASRIPPSTSVVVDMDSKDFALIPKTDIYANAEIDPMDWEDIWSGLRSAQNVGRGDMGIFISKDYRCSFPVRILKSDAGPDGTKTLCVQVADDIRKGRSYGSTLAGGNSPYNAVVQSEPRYVNWAYDTWDSPKCDGGLNDDQPGDSERYKNRCRAHHIKLVRKPCSMTNVTDTLIMSMDDVRFMPIKGTADSYNFKGSLDLGSEPDLDARMKKLGIHNLAMEYDGHQELAVRYRGSKTPRMSKNACLAHLIKVAGMDERAARILIDRSRKEERVSVLVKEAISLEQQPAQYDPTYGTPVQNPYNNREIIQDASVQRNRNPQDDLMPVIDPVAQRQAGSAADKGQKDVFDISILGGLVKTTQVNDKINEFLKDIILGNDRLGRLLFMFYWHNEKFVDQYGDEDMAELEDLLRNVFESNGDLVLFLKQKSVEPESIATESVISL
jgi:hypothetical protein